MVVQSSAAPFWRERASFPTQIIKVVVLLAVVIVMVFPFWYVLSVSLSSERDLQGANVSLFPLHPSLLAYQTILQGGVVLNALVISVGVTLIGTLACMVMTRCFTRSSKSSGSSPAKNVLLGS